MIGFSIEQEHVALTTAKGQRRCWQVGNVIDMFAENIDPRGGTQQRYWAVAIEIEKKSAEPQESVTPLRQRGVFGFDVSQSSF